MKILIAILRLLGLFIILLGALKVVADYESLSRLFFNFDNFISLLYSFAQSLVFGVICFGVASGLVTLRRVDEKTDAIGRMLNRRRSSQAHEPKDLAPVAPNWSTPLEPPRQEVTPGFKPMRRIDRYSIGAPTVREAPRAIRTTPGAEDQYVDDDPLAQRDAYLRKPPDPPPTRYMLRRAKDAQIRRKQNGQ